MPITLEPPDDVFAVPKASAEFAREARPLEPAPVVPPDFKALLLEMPEGGDDSDLARTQDPGRPDEPWGA
jgi:hypothetical protein